MVNKETGAVTRYRARYGKYDIPLECFETHWLSFAGLDCQTHLLNEELGIGFGEEYENLSIDQISSYGDNIEVKYSGADRNVTACFHDIYGVKRSEGKGTDGIVNLNVPSGTMGSVVLLRDGELKDSKQIRTR